MNWKKFFIGACALLTVTGTPQASAVEVFGSEFEENTVPTQQESQVVEEVQPEPQPVAQETPPPVEVEEVQPEPQPIAQETPPPVEVEEVQPVEVPTLQPEPQTLNSAADDENLGDDLNFDTSDRPVVEVPTVEPPTLTVPAATQNPQTELNTLQPAETDSPTPTTAKSQTKQKKLKLQKPRFVKLTMDESYVYYLDKQAVTWRRLPYSSSEYMADVWIRMVERDDDDTEYPAEEVELAAEQGKQLPDVDIEVLQHRRYYLEHYYLRPKTEQIQFLSELEIVDRPQNTSNERKYDYQNWEYLIPGSMESVIYRTVIQTIGTSKASERGHMTFTDMLEEYARISVR